MFYYLICVSAAQCKSTHRLLPFSMLTYETSVEEETLCWSWEAGERIITITPLIHNDTIIKLYGGVRNLAPEDTPDYVITGAMMNAPYSFTKSVVFGVAQLPPHSFIHTMSVNIPVPRCMKGVSYSTKKVSSWRPLTDFNCVVIGNGEKVDLKLSRAVGKGTYYEVYSPAFKNKAMIIANNTHWITDIETPVLIQSRGQGIFPDINFVSSGFSRNHIEMEGMIEDTKSLFLIGVICSLLAAFFILAITLSTARCYYKWSQGVSIPPPTSPTFF